MTKQLVFVFSLAGILSFNTAAIAGDGLTSPIAQWPIKHDQNTSAQILLWKDLANNEQFVVDLTNATANITLKRLTLNTPLGYVPTVGTCFYNAIESLNIVAIAKPSKIAQWTDDIYAAWLVKTTPPAFTKIPTTGLRCSIH